MGGRSSSSINVGQNGLFFRGNIVTQGGGFASMRTRGDESALQAALQGSNGVTVSGVSDGRMYKLCFRTKSDDSFVYQHDIPPTQGTFSAQLRFSDFIPSWRGRRIEAPLLRGESILSVGIILSLLKDDGSPNPAFGSGPFEVRIDDIIPGKMGAPQNDLKRLDEQQRKDLSSNQNNDSLREAIRKGAPMWNAGDIDGTVQLYSAACQKNGSPSLLAALADVRRFSARPEAAGWILRTAMDHTLEPRRRAEDEVASAIELGVPFFNGGLPEVCASIYIRAGRLAGFNRAVAEAENQTDPARAAWTMRRAFDNQR